MDAIEQVNDLAAATGALVRVESYSPFGRRTDTRSDDVPFVDYRISREAFAWFATSETTPHSITILKAETDGDEVRLTSIPDSSGGYVVVVVSPIWTPEQHAEVKRWKAWRDEVVVAAELADLHAAAASAKAPKAPGGRDLTFTASWISAPDPGEGEMRTAGVVAVRGGEFAVKCFEQFPNIETEIAERFAEGIANGGNAQDIFWYMIDTANGIAVDFSAPFEVEGKTAELAAELALSTSALA